MGFGSKLKKAIKNPGHAMDVVKKNLDREAGKVIYKNTAGLQQNRMGEKTMKAVEKSRINISIQEHEETYSKLNETGVVELGKPYDSALLQKIVKKYNEMIEDDKYSHVRSEFEGKIYSRQLSDPRTNIPEITELITEKLQTMIRGFYRGNFQISYFSMWRNYHIPPEVISSNKEIFANHWHCDQNDTSQTILFSNLSDVTADDGPLECMTLGRTKELVKMGFGNRGNYKLSDDVVNDPRYISKLIGTSGTSVWAWTTMALHRAGEPTPGKTRDLMQVRLIPSVEPYNTSWPDYSCSYQKEYLSK